MNPGGRRVLLLLASYTGVALAGITAGLSFAADARVATVKAADMLLIHRYAQYARLQQMLGGPKEYRDALRSFAVALDETRDSRKNRPSELTSYFEDKALTYIRLSRLEQSLGNRQATDDYLKAAEIASSQMTAWHLGVDALVAMSAELDRRTDGWPTSCGPGPR